MAEFVGIDLGTTLSGLAYLKPDGNPEIEDQQRPGTGRSGSALHRPAGSVGPGGIFGRVWRCRAALV